MDDRLTLVYISDILSDENVLLIEVWARVLYVRYKKGRNKFVSKKKLEYEQEVYYRINEYKSLLKLYHPDKVQGSIKQERATNLARLINDARRTMGIYQGVYRAVHPIRHLQQFREYLSLFKTKKGDKLRDDLRTLCKTRFRHCFQQITTQSTSSISEKSEEKGYDFKEVKDFFGNLAKKRGGGRIGKRPDISKLVDGILTDAGVYCN